MLTMYDILVLLIFWIASALAVKSPVTQIGLMPTCAVSISLLFVVKRSPLTGFAEASMHNFGILYLWLQISRLQL